MTHVIGRGRYARETYPAAGVQRVGQVPNEILRYSFTVPSGTPSAMAGTDQDPIANQLGATPQDEAASTNFAALFFTAPGGKLGLGDLVVFNPSGGSGPKIDLRFLIATVASPIPTPIGPAFLGVADPSVAGVVGSQIDCSSIVVPPGGAVIGTRFTIHPGTNIGALAGLQGMVIALAVGVYWDPASILLPPA
jgi:hypothetical protein